MPEVLATGVAALGAVLLLVRAVVARDEPWWVAWPAPLGAVVLVAALLTGTAVLLAVGVVGLVVGLGTQLGWAHRRGRYLEDDVRVLWRRARRRPPPRTGRHRVRDD